MTFKVITHYNEDDPEQYGDYVSVEIFENDTKIIEYEDYYHDKGEEKAEGFINAVSYLMPDAIIKYESISDFT